MASSLHRLHSLTVTVHPAPMSYDQVDPVIRRRVESVGSVLFTGTADRPARYFHLPGDPPFECFQVSIGSPRDGRIWVTAAAIDTNDDTELELLRTWEGPVSGLDGMLDSAFAAIELWKARERRKPDPPSPW